MRISSILLNLWWAQQDSNLRLPPCEGGTLPLSYAPGSRAVVGNPHPASIPLLHRPAVVPPPKYNSADPCPLVHRMANRRPRPSPTPPERNRRSATTPPASRTTNSATR